MPTRNKMPRGTMIRQQGDNMPIGSKMPKGMIEGHRYASETMKCD